MYLFRPNHWFTRATASAGKSSGSSSGSRVGSSASGVNRGASGGSSGSSSGSSGGSRGSSASGSSGSTLRSGGSASSGSKSKVISTGARLGSSMRGPIWTRPSGSYYGGYYGYPYYRPLYPNYYLLFGFWPIPWVSDYPDGYPSTNNTRPGGPLITAPVSSAGSSNTTYIIYGDTQSVEDMLPSLILDCGATNSSTPFNISTNTTMQTYREDSFALLGFSLDKPGRNASFESCLNDTIADNLLVIASSGQASIGPVGAMWSLVVVLCFAMSKM